MTVLKLRDQLNALIARGLGDLAITNVMATLTARQWRAVIRKDLRRHKITQAELARRLRVAPPQVSDWMTGKVEPGLDTARRVLLTLNRSVARAIRGAS